jgi:transposase
MPYRELSVIEVKDVLRYWAGGESTKAIVRRTGLSRNAVRRYVRVAQEHGLLRGEVVRALDDGLLALVVAGVRPGGSREFGEARKACEAHRSDIESWSKDCDGPKICKLLLRQHGVSVPLRTLQRFMKEELRDRRAGDTMRLGDPDPGVLEFDFLDFGTYVDAGTGQPVKLSGALKTASVSRHQFLWPCHHQRQDDVIEALEAAWAFFGGVFPVLLPDNLSAVVQKADAVNPRFNEWFVEYAQARGITLDPARVRRPRDKARVERQVRFVRRDFFGGESFGSLKEIREAAERWCREDAGERDHGTHRRHPIDVFEEVERSALHPAPTEPYDVPQWSEHTVGRDHAVRVGEALYSVPYTYRGKVSARSDRTSVKLYGSQHQLLKVHVRAPRGGTQLDPSDAPPGRQAAVDRSCKDLFARADAYSDLIGSYARRLAPDPKRIWSDIRRVYRLLGACETYGSEAVEEACRRALELEVVDIKRIEGMLEKGLEKRVSVPTRTSPPARGQLLAFERPRSAFAVSTEVDR